MNHEAHRGRLFLGCIIALVATAFGFIIRALILGDWEKQFNLSQEQKGYILGAGALPFAISIILFSLIVDKIGYGVSMVYAFVGHLIGCALTIYAGFITDRDAAFQLLYVGTFITALANGIVEAVINPVTATIFADKKTHYLNILHAGWPGGLVLGGLLTLAFGLFDPADFPALGMVQWQWKVALILLPILAYGLLLMGQKFPVQERVAAGVSFRDMMREFGAASCFIVTFLVAFGTYQVLNVFGIKSEDPLLPMYVSIGVAAGLAIAFAFAYQSFGRPMFVFLLIIMLLLATTELGTDSWISDIMKNVLKTPDSTFDWGALVLIYTSFIMFVLRFFAGPIVHRISPLGLLAVSAAIACGGLFFIANAGTALGMVFIAATLYGFGKTFFWPTTLGVVSEQFPRGGALMLNAIAGVGMIGVGVLGLPLMGTIQDKRIDSALVETSPKREYENLSYEETSLLGPAKKLDQDELALLGKSKTELLKKKLKQAEDPKTKISKEKREEWIAGLNYRLSQMPDVVFGYLKPDAQKVLKDVFKWDAAAIARASGEELVEQLDEKKVELTAALSQAGVPADSLNLFRASAKALAEEGELKDPIEKATGTSRQKFLAEVAILPGIMFLCYMILIGYFASRGGYKVKEIHHEEEAASEY